MRYFLALLLLASLIILGCEKDDICSEDTETTPRMIIDFYNNDNPDNIKTVERIIVQGIGNELIMGDINNPPDVTSLILPLRTDTLETSYSLYQDFSINDNNTPDDTSDDFIEGNEDIITITYNIEEVYVSRACGYKTIFTEVIVSVVDDGDNWILNTQPVSEDFQNIENERETHYNIFH